MSWSDRGRVSGAALAVVFGLIATVLVRQADAQSAGAASLASLGVAGGQGNGPAGAPSLSDDGRFVAFHSHADDLVPDDTEGTVDVFVRDRLAQITERISVNSLGEEASGASVRPALSGDSRWVAFESEAGDLVPGDGNGLSDIFLHDRLTRTTSRISVGPGGSDADGASRMAAISTDGRYLAFESEATNLVEGDGNGLSDVFVFDRQIGAMTRASVNATGGDGQGFSVAPALSGDGRWLAFVSDAPDIDPAAGYLPPWRPNGERQVFLRDLILGQTQMISRAWSGDWPRGKSVAPSIDDRGERVAFASYDRLLENERSRPWSTPRVMLWERTTGALREVSAPDPWWVCQLMVPQEPWLCPGMDMNPALSGDGRWVAYQTTSNGLLPGDPATATWDEFWAVHTNLTGGPVRYQLFLENLDTGRRRRVSVNSASAPATACSSVAAVSDDGGVVAWRSAAADLVWGDLNGTHDVVVSEWACGEATGTLGTGMPLGCEVPVKCPAAPSTGCATARTGVLRLRRPGLDDPRPGEQSLALLWAKAGSLPAASFGDPTRTGGGYDLCLYAGPTPRLVAEVAIPGGAGWQATSDGFVRRGGSGAVSRMSVAARRERSRISLRGEGAGLDLPYLPLDERASLELRLEVRDSADCFAATIPARAILEDEAGLGERLGRFSARLP